MRRPLNIPKPTLRRKANGRYMVSRRVSTFFVCLVLATIFWFLHMLSKEYNEVVCFPVEYVNFPKDKVVSNRLPDSLNIEVRTTGFSLLPFSFGESPQKIRIDVATAQKLSGSDYFYFAANTRIDRIARQLGSRFAPVRVQPDTIFFNYSKKATRLVPVHPRLHVECATDYRLADSVTASPANVLISGSEALVKRVNFVETEVKTIKDVDESTTVPLKIATTGEQRQLTIDPVSVNAVVKVAKFTEGSVQINVTAKNLPPGYKLQTIPSKVKVTYVTAVDEFKNVNAEMFNAVVDYKHIQAGSKKLKVTLSRVPLNVRGVRVEPEQVEFILKK